MPNADVVTQCSHPNKPAALTLIRELPEILTKFSSSPSSVSEVTDLQPDVEALRPRFSDLHDQKTDYKEHIFFKKM